MQKTATILTIILLLTIATASAQIKEVGNSAKLKMIESEIIQGGTTDFCIPSGNNTDIKVTFPNGKSKTYKAKPDTIAKQESNELCYEFRDTQQTGNYTITYTTKEKGKDVVTTELLEVSPLSVIIDYIDSIRSVDVCKSVQEVNEPDIKVHGTEYTFGQQVKVWLQLINGSGDYVNNALCYTDIYTPDDQQYLYQVLMTPNGDGIYYYDIPTPANAGVYPVTVRCYYGSTTTVYNSSSINVTTGQSLSSNTHESFESGTFSGGTNWYDGAWYTEGQSAVTTLGTPYNGTYHLRLRSYTGYVDRRVDLTNADTVTLSFWAKANSFETGEEAYAYIESSSGTSSMINIETWANGDDDNIWRHYTYDLETEGVTFDGTIYLAFESAMSGTGDYFYVDDIDFKIESSQDVTKLAEIDSDYVTILEESVSGKSRLNFTIDFLDMSECAQISEELLIGITLTTHAKFDSVANDDITMSIYNHTSNKWQTLPNNIPEGATFSTITNNIETTNITKSGFYQAGTGITIKFNDSNYADSTNNNILLDQAIMKCNQLSDPEWQDVKGSSEIHISSAGEYQYEVSTLCGTGSDKSICAEFRIDPIIINEAQGYVFENITFINDHQKYVDETFAYETSTGFDCTSILDIIKEKNGTSNSIIHRVSTGVGSLGDNCIMYIPVEFDDANDREFNVVIQLDNFAKWEGEWMEDFVNLYTQKIEEFCYDVEDRNGLNFTIPINESLDYLENNTIALNCWRSIDDLYWFYDSYTKSQDSTTVGDYSQYLVGMRFYFPEIRNHFQILSDISIQNIPLYDSKTLCGVNHKDYTCAKIMPPDSYFDSQEGYIIENVTITNIYTTNLNEDYEYSTAEGVDCTAILDILWVVNETEIDLYDSTNFGLGTKDNCDLTIVFNMTDEQETGNLLIYMENYVAWDILQRKDQINGLRSTIETFCDDIATEQNITYDLPISDNIDTYLSNPDILYCYRAKDNLYWIDYFLDDYNTTNYETIGEIESLHYEITDFYQDISNDHTAINIFKNKNLTLTEISTLINGININISDLNITTTINETAIAEEVWSWNDIGNKLIEYVIYQYEAIISHVTI